MFYKFGLTLLGISLLIFGSASKAEAKLRLFVTVLDGFNQIYELDSQTGARLNAFPAPEPLTGDDGLAYDGRILWSFSDNGTTTEVNIFGINANTGEVLETHTIQRPPQGVFTGLTVRDGFLFLLDRINQTINRYNPADGTVDITQLQVSAPLALGLGSVNPFLIGLINVSSKKFLTEINGVFFDMDPFFAPIATVPGIVGGLDGAGSWIFAASFDNGPIVIKVRTDGSDMTPLDGQDFTDPFTGLGVGDDDDSGNIGNEKMVDAKLLETFNGKVTNTLDLTGSGFVYIAICTETDNKGRVKFDPNTIKSATLRDSRDGSTPVTQANGTSLKDVDKDGDNDLIIRFSKDALLKAGVNESTKSLILEGTFGDSMTPYKATIAVGQVKIK